MAVAPGTADPFRLAQEALDGGLHVLFTCSPPISPGQFHELTKLAGVRQRILRIAEPFRYRPGFDFLERLISGKEPLCQPAYLRILRLTGHDCSNSLEEAVTEELAWCTALIPVMPDALTAAGTSSRHSAGPAAIFLTLRFVSGFVAQLTVSAAEGYAGRQVVVATGERTVAFDEGEALAPLRLTRWDREAVVAPARSPIAPPPDAVAEEARRFVEAASVGDLSASNGRLWTTVAALRRTADSSLCTGETLRVEHPALEYKSSKMPPLRVIRGGGHGTGAASHRPRLAVVPN